VYQSNQAVNQELYRELLATFPSSEMKSEMGERFFSEIDSDRHPKQFRSVVAKSKQWRSIWDEVSRPKFRQALLQRFHRQLCEIHGEDKIRQLRVSDTQVKCSFHCSRNGFLLAPHTDTGLKLITIIFYLAEVGEELTGAGTRFYRARVATAGDQYIRDLLDDEDKRRLEDPFGIVGVALERIYAPYDRGHNGLGGIQQFDDVHECILQTEFVSNRMILFIKSNNSWHDVRLEALPDAQFRKSFVINLLAVPEIQRSFIWGARRRLVRLLNI
jgi:hypothetical protein